jgi:tetratricopeptide (TPR) repeat protein
VKKYHKIVFALLSLILFVLIGCQSQYMTAGKVYLQQQPPNYDAAIEQFKKATEAEPQNPETYIWLGKAYAFKKQFEEACKQTEKALKIAPGVIDKLKKDTDLNYWAVYENAGMEYIKNKDFENGLKRFDRALDFEPKKVQTMNYIAYCYESLDKKDKAEEVYLKAIELVPENIETYINLSNLYKVTEEIDKEEQVMLQAKKIVDDPDWLKVEDDRTLKARKKLSAKVYIGLGTILLRNDKPEEAEEVLQKAITMAPEDKDVNFNYGIALFDLEKYQDAVNPFKKVVALDSTDKEAYVYLGLSYLKTENYEEAKEAFTRVIEIDPQYCEAYINRAFAEREMGDKDAAYKDAKLGVECKENK